jgi:serine/threonine protein kinase
MLVAPIADGLWRARRASDGLPIAVRLLRAHGPIEPMRARVDELCQGFSNQLHPALIPVFDMVTDGVEVAIVTEFVLGGTAASVATRGPLPPSTVHAIAIRVATALAELHRAHLTHGLVCGQSVIMDAADESARLGEVATSSLARGVAPLPATLLESHAECMAPEITATGPTPAADIYALGILVEQLLAGTPDTRRAALRRMRHAAEMGVTDRSVPLASQRLIAEMTATAPGDRPTAQEALGRLRSAAESEGSAGGPVRAGSPHRNTILHRQARKATSITDHPTVVRPSAQVETPTPAAKDSPDRTGGFRWGFPIDRLRTWWRERRGSRTTSVGPEAPPPRFTYRPLSAGHEHRPSTPGEPIELAEGGRFPRPPESVTRQTVWTSRPPPPPGPRMTPRQETATVQGQMPSVREET